MSADDENEEAKKKARAERFQYTEEATNSGEYDQDDQDDQDDQGCWTLLEDREE